MTESIGQREIMEGCIHRAPFKTIWFVEQEYFYALAFKSLAKSVQ